MQKKKGRNKQNTKKERKKKKKKEERKKGRKKERKRKLILYSTRHQMFGDTITCLIVSIARRAGVGGFNFYVSGTKIEEKFGSET